MRLWDCLSNVKEYSLKYNMYVPLYSVYNNYIYIYMHKAEICTLYGSSMVYQSQLMCNTEYRQLMTAVEKIRKRITS